jgi:hypothetical protein
VNPNVKVRNIAGLNIPEHDHFKETYVGGVPSSDDARPETITFRQGGAAGPVVCKLTITYHGATNNIDEVLRTDS